MSKKWSEQNKDGLISFYGGGVSDRKTLARVFAYRTFKWERAAAAALRVFKIPFIAKGNGG